MREWLEQREVLFGVVVIVLGAVAFSIAPVFV
jgi:hypothetical protein